MATVTAVTSAARPVRKAAMETLRRLAASAPLGISLNPPVTKGWHLLKLYPRQGRASVIWFVELEQPDKEGEESFISTVTRAGIPLWIPVTSTTRWRPVPDSATVPKPAAVAAADVVAVYCRRRKPLKCTRCKETAENPPYCAQCTAARFGLEMKRSGIEGAGLGVFTVGKRTYVTEICWGKWWPRPRTTLLLTIAVIIIDFTVAGCAIVDRFEEGEWIAPYGGECLPIKFAARLGAGGRQFTYGA
jgi:hypothetical protein